MVSTGVTASAVYTRSPQMGNAAWCRAFECAGAEQLGDLLFYLGAGILTLALVAAALYLGQARRVCETESSRTRTERDAYIRFLRRLSGISVSQVTTQVQTSGMTVANVQSADQSIREVREAFEETVMTVPHFTEEYDESLEVHMAMEFGDELARAVRHGTQLTPPLKQALVQQAELARDQRDAMLGTLDRELEELEDATALLESAEEELDDVSSEPFYRRSYADLHAAWERLDDIEDRVTTVLTERQHAMQEGIRFGIRRTDSGSFHDYLYRPLDVSYPVLADGAKTVDRIQAIRHNVVDMLTRRV
ncbi:MULTISPECIES: hypothetical protein [unclassified Haladaptatus]|uniref:DUF7260 family protein n=1 Tax=unclassified Haladaptatus TaxID=2622732 RepID=UPI0023E8A230|nr:MULTISPECIES: hypothetical protein [unclassified Haladaptatus]